MTDQVERLTNALADRYKIERELGAGGMATVYLAEDVRHHRKVAVKVLRPELAVFLGPDRFTREIEIAAKLTHPHILTLIDSGDADGLLYYVMPYIDGESLRAKLNSEGELSIGFTVKILRDVVDALASAHKHGIVHRDIKPDNVLLLENHAFVTDFGVAKAVSDATGRTALTTAGVALGTPAYMAPEQVAADSQVDHRADIYAVGAVAYELVSGHPPFDGDTQQEILSAHVMRSPEPLTSARTAVPPELAGLIMRCLQKKPADRYQTTDEVLASLEAISTAGAESAHSGAPRGVATRIVRRRKQVAIGLTMATLAALTSWFLLTRGEAMHDLDPNLVAVFPFRTAGVHPELQYLREGIVDLLYARLTGEGGPLALAPQTTISAWQRAGGSENSDLPEERALELAADLGTAQLLQGGIVGTPNRVTLNATLHDVMDGTVTARANVEGPADSLATLIDRLTGQLLAMRAGVEARSLSDLTSTSLAALKAYLQGQAEFRRGRYVKALEHFDRALLEDSTFALAALWQSIDATWGTARSLAPGRRLAWTHRDRLGPRDRVLLEAWAGSNFPGPTPFAQWIVDAERAVSAMSDRWETWFLFGDRLYHFGTLVGLPNPLDRALGAFERALEMNPDFGPILLHLVDHAVFTGDTARVREVRARHHSALGSMAHRQEWLTATSLQDTAALRDWRSDLDGIPRAEVLGAGTKAQQMVLGLDDAELALRKALDRAVTPQESRQSLDALTVLMLNLGRPRAALEFTRRAGELGGDDGLHFDQWNQMSRALFWGADTSIAIDAARFVQNHTAEPVSADIQVRRRQIGDHCNLGIWHSVNGDTDAAVSALDWLRDFPGDEAPFDWQAFRRACVTTLETVLAAPGDRRLKLGRLDSLLRTGPNQNEYPRRWMNLMAARLYEEEGDVARALAAVRRREFGLSVWFESTLYREEGRLAAMAGDTTGAIQAYGRYLALRFNPEPEVRAEVERVRGELARLVGEPRNR